MSFDRRRFIKTTAKAVTASMFMPVLFHACVSDKPRFSISLAQWSLHRRFFKQHIHPHEFPVIARREFGIGAVEYVNQFFQDKAGNIAYLKEMKNRCDDEGVKSLILMIDEEGALGSTNEKVRHQAIENHTKWIDVAAFWGCHAIRINLYDDGAPVSEWKKAGADALSQLATRAKEAGLMVLVENHGGYSSHGGHVADIISAVNHDSCGTLPDFGNFCLEREGGEPWGTPCIKSYDPYQGIEELIPFAGGISAKAFAFDEEGHETSIDYKRMFTIIKKSSYSGHIGIEYEGDDDDEAKGILATKRLIERYI